VKPAHQLGVEKPSVGVAFFDVGVATDQDRAAGAAGDLVLALLADQNGVTGSGLKTSAPAPPMRT